MQIQNRERAWSRGRKCFEPLRIPMTSSLLLTFKSNWITWMSNEHCAALCAPTAAISQLFLSKLLRSRRRRVSLIRVLCLRPGAFLDRLPRESQSLVVALGGIQFCKLLALSKLENCTALAEALLSRSVYCAHKGLLVAYTVLPKTSKDSHESLKPSLAVPRRRTRVLPCSLDRLRRETKENITRVARRPLNGSFLRVWCSWDVARQIAAASPAAMERIARSLTGSHTSPENREF